MAGSSISIARPPAAHRAPRLAAWAAVIAIALLFVAKYVFRYYLHYNELAFTDPLTGAANYWQMRGWLLLHITGGTAALLSGPTQFSTRLRQRSPRFHRTMGYVFLSGVGIGSLASFRLALGTTFGWAWALGMVSLGLAWIATSGMALYAIKLRQFQVHKEWMVRAYVVTFAFVTFRLLNDFGPTSRLQPDSDRANAFIWASWALPLLAAELIMQFRKLRRAAAPA